MRFVNVIMAQGDNNGVRDKMAVVQEMETVRIYTASDTDIPEKFAEIIEGELIVVTPAGFYHNSIALNLHSIFRKFIATRPNLRHGGDNDGFLLRRTPFTLLSPDASLFYDRSPYTTTWLEFAPEIAVEILSPSNAAMEMVVKRHKYFEAGTQQFWLVDPDAKTLSIYYPDNKVLAARSGQKILGTGIAEGLELNLDDLFADR